MTTRDRHLLNNNGISNSRNEPIQLPKDVMFDRIKSLAKSNRRVMLGIVGQPGVGKTSLAHRLALEVGGSAQIVGMDGFHLSRTRLESLGRLNRMGAIDTFDSYGFVTLLERLRQIPAQTVYAPEFHRDEGESIANALVIEPDTNLVIVEGNYLLVHIEPWTKIRTILDEVWYCERDERDRIQSLIQRHMALGMSIEDARAWALGSDQDNAQLIAGTRGHADAIVKLETYPDERD